WVCEPRQVCTAATCFGFLISEMSKILTPRKRSFCATGMGFFASSLFLLTSLLLSSPLVWSLSPAAGGGGSGGKPCESQSRRPFGWRGDPSRPSRACPGGARALVQGRMDSHLRHRILWRPLCLSHPLPH